MANDAKQSLTKTEADVVELLCEGLTNREIGRRLHIAESTVRWHLKNVFRKLGARTRTERCGGGCRATRGAQIHPYQDINDTIPPICRAGPRSRGTNKEAKAKVDLQPGQEKVT